MGTINSRLFKAAESLSKIEGATVVVFAAITKDGQFYGGTGSDETLTEHQRDLITSYVKRMMIATATDIKQLDVARCLRSLPAHLITLKEVNILISKEAVSQESLIAQYEIMGQVEQYAEELQTYLGE